MDAFQFGFWPLTSQVTALTLRWVLVETSGRVTGAINQFSPAASCHWLVNFLDEKYFLCKRFPLTTVMATLKKHDGHAKLAKRRS